MEGKMTLQLYRNMVSIGDEEIHCDRLGAVILFQCRMNTLMLKCRQGFVGRAMDCPLCGAVVETVAHFCHRVHGAGGGGGAVWGNPGGSFGGNIAFQSEDRGEGREEHPIVEGEEEKWTNKSKDLHISSAGT